MLSQKLRDISKRMKNKNARKANDEPMKVEKKKQNQFFFLSLHVQFWNIPVIFVSSVAWYVRTFSRDSQTRVRAEPNRWLADKAINKAAIYDCVTRNRSSRVVRSSQAQKLKYFVPDFFVRQTFLKISISGGVVPSSLIAHAWWCALFVCSHCATGMRHRAKRAKRDTRRRSKHEKGAKKNIKLAVVSAARFLSPGMQDSPRRRKPGQYSGNETEIRALDAKSPSETRVTREFPNNCCNA